MFTPMIPLALLALAPAWTVSAPVDPAVFGAEGQTSIMEEDHFGIINGKLSVGVNYKNVGSLSGMWSPPYVSSDFLLELRLFGEKAPTDRFRWLPGSVTSSGATHEVGVFSATALVSGLRAGVLALTLTNPASESKEVPLQFVVRGTLDRTEVWEFPRPVSQSAAPPTVERRILIKAQGPLALLLQTDLDGLQWDENTSAWQTSIVLSAGEKKKVHVAFSIGVQSEALTACNMILADPDQAVARALGEYGARVQDLFEKLPALASGNTSLTNLYNRSLVHFLMNRWDIPEFVLHPYYGTGSVKGGCVCDYLWNFGEVWEILPLYDPQAAREHIKQFLKTDLTSHFAFNPITGKAFGPWYPVNQEKIIGLIYYYVKNTGDTAFLNETVNGKSLLEWAVYHAMYGDDPSNPVALIDYGPSNSHLELRRGYPYHHVMPDLNGRRYANYRMADQLAEVAGKPVPYLKDRADALKILLKEKLWDPQARWFCFLDDKGHKDLRYTVQMFKLFGSGVLDEEEEAGLLSHLNETEFLSEQGLHSMSKTDVAYDQVDIDNGGGGNCTCFPPQIAERLYKSGHADKAEDILGRICWWGERMPYWGDSLVANSIDYRKDTPLQCTIDGVTVAQCIIFGLFGVEARFNGDIMVHPHPPAFAPQITLKGLRLRGASLDISVDGGEYLVRSGEQVVRAKVGASILLRAADGQLAPQ